MPDLTAIQREIRERLSEVERLLEPLRIEREQLQKMLGDARPPAAEPAPRVKATARPRSATVRAGRGRRRESRSRAQQALARIAAQPGITVAELAAAMGIKANYLYRVLPALAKDGKIVKQGKGYRPAAGSVAASDGGPTP